MRISTTPKTGRKVPNPEGGTNPKSLQTSKCQSSVLQSLSGGLLIPGKKKKKTHSNSAPRQGELLGRRKRPKREVHSGTWGPALHPWMAETLQGVLTLLVLKETRKASRGRAGPLHSQDGNQLEESAFMSEPGFLTWRQPRL